MVPALRGALSLGIGPVEYVLDGDAVVELGHQTVKISLLRRRVSLLGCLVDCLAAVREVIRRCLLLKGLGNSAFVPCVGVQSYASGGQVEFLSHCCLLVSVRSLRGTAIQC